MQVANLQVKIDFELKYNLTGVDTATVQLAKKDPKKLLDKLIGKPSLNISSQQKILLVLKILKTHREKMPVKIAKSIKKLDLTKKEKSLLATFMIWDLDKYPLLKEVKYFALLLKRVNKKHIVKIYDAKIPKERFLKMGQISIALARHTREWGKALDKDTRFDATTKAELRKIVVPIVREKAIDKAGWDD